MVATRRYAGEQAPDDEACQEVPRTPPRCRARPPRPRSCGHAGGYGYLGAAEDDRAVVEPYPLELRPRIFACFGPMRSASIDQAITTRTVRTRAPAGNLSPHRRALRAPCSSRWRAREASRLLVVVSDGDDGYLLHQAVRFLIGVLVDARNAVTSRASGMEPPPPFNRTGTNVTAQDPAVASSLDRDGLAEPQETDDRRKPHSSPGLKLN